jgi:phenylacetate-CoA ligase
MALQWAGRDEIRRLQERKLRQLIAHSYDAIPYFRTLLDQARLSSTDVSRLEDLEKLPITTKSELQRRPVAELTDRSIDISTLRSERTSGSSGRPFTVLYDSGARISRACAFLRALRCVGYRVGQRLMLVATSRSAGRRRGLPGWRYASFEDTGESLSEQFERFSPHFLYGCVTPLRLLAENLGESGAASRRLRGVITTAETLDHSTRDLLQSAFQCDVFDFYGLSEMGLVAWECQEHNGYHVAEDTVVVEQIVQEGGEQGARLVMTNLDSTAMPFIRFDSGDLGTLREGVDCGCGRSLKLLERIEGRVVDCVVLEDGRRVSPYSLTCALEEVLGIARYQVVQSELRRFTLRIEASDDGGPDPAIVCRIMRGVLGREIEVGVEIDAVLKPEPGEKFRVVESLVGARHHL